MNKSIAGKKGAGEKLSPLSGNKAALEKAELEGEPSAAF